jgi:8-oxo-dGTP pyrophosphatase MutT (NUDIX family)
VTYPAGGENRLFNLVVRALSFHEGHLLVSRWAGGYCFPVGGRLDHGERLDEAIRREFREETGIGARVRRLVYLHENFFVDRAGKEIHELGWHFWVEAESAALPLGISRPHPDHEDLRLTYVPLYELGQAGLLPAFLVDTLPSDFASEFNGCPRHFISQDVPGRPMGTVELGWFGGGSPG